MYKIALALLLSLSFTPAIAVMYCDGMGSLAELAGKMRDAGRTEKQILMDLRKISPSGMVNKDIADLVGAVFTKFGRTQSPSEFRSFFETFCRQQGFDKTL